jgi:hypothetical protein
MSKSNNSQNPETAVDMLLKTLAVTCHCTSVIQPSIMSLVCVSLWPVILNNSSFELFSSRVYFDWSLYNIRT